MSTPPRTSPCPLPPDLIPILKEVSRDLWSSYSGEGRQPVIIFPRYRSGAVRVSEQEARFALARVLGRRRICFSLETPTSTRFRFAELEGEKRSCLTDLSAYVPGDSGSKWLNVELKARTGGRGYSKDVEKLVIEKCDGLWFHLLETKERGDLRSVIGQLEPAVEAAFGKREGTLNASSEPWQLWFAFCFLVPRKLLVGKFQLEGPATGQRATICKGLRRVLKADATASLWRLYTQGAQGRVVVASRSDWDSIGAVY